MRTEFIVWAILLSIGFVNAQEKKMANVRIKKVEIVNGVEKVTDTTYTTDKVESLDMNSDTTTVKEFTGKDGNKKKVIIINDNIKDGQRIIENDSSGQRTIIIGTDKDAQGNAIQKKYIIEDPSMMKGGERTIYINDGKELTKEEEKALLEATRALREASGSLREADTKLRQHSEELRKCSDKLREQMIVLDEEVIKEGNSPERKITKYIMIRTVNVAEMTPEDHALISRTTGIPDGKLKVEEMKFYPNPNDGLFNLSFSLTQKGATEVSIMNMEGKKVYEEKIADFDGKYDRQIDISKQPRGAYFLSIKQGDHAQLKKIVLD